MKDVIFREYDIRGIVGSELLLDKVYDLGAALAVYFSVQKVSIRTVIIGRDARVDSGYIQEQLSNALLSAGYAVFDAGVCSSPVVYFGLHAQKYDAGVVVTASHNPAEYNGLKICLHSDPLSPQEIQELKMIYHQKKTVSFQAVGALVITKVNLINDYVDWIVEHFAHLKNKVVPVVFDCGNGTTGPELLKVINRLGLQETKILYAIPDGTFPHHEADPAVVHNMQDLKKELDLGNFWFGIGLDGDGDRMGAMTQQGNLIPADQLLALFAQKIMSESAALSVGVVCDIRSSQGLVTALQSWGARAYWSAAGHSYIKKKMKECKAVLGGELSCHFMFSDRYFGYDDALYAALRLIELVVLSGKTLQDLLSFFPRLSSSAEIRLQCKAEDIALLLHDIHTQFDHDPNVSLVTIDGIRVLFADGWGLVRKSNTQPVISMRFESDSEQGLVRIKKIFFALLQPYFDRVIVQKALGI